MRLHRLLCALLPLFLAACATNPVTGKRELRLVSEAQEVAMGRQAYGPAQQAQGGPFRLDPALVDYVARVGRRLAAVSDRPKLPYEFTVVNDGTPNAWALPGGKIAVNRGLLLALHDEAELAAVLSHEIVHAAARHGAKSLERGLLLQAGLAGLAVALEGDREQRLVVGAAALAAQLVSQRYSRAAELEADRYGMAYMARADYDPCAAVDLQKTFVRLARGRNENWLAGLFASHPPSRARVEANEKTARRLGGCRGERGAQAYAAATARLRRAAPAYALYEKGRKALADGRPRAALELAEAAWRREPDEALFYGLGAQAAYALGRDRQARRLAEKAIARNPDYHLFHLLRGLALKRLRRPAAARAALERAVALLPTVTAHLALGELAEAAGDTEAALAHYRAAAQGEGASARRAARRLARLELPLRPGRYLEVRPAADPAGRLVLEIRNRGPLPVTELRLAVRGRTETGRRVERRYAPPGTLGPGEGLTLPTALPAGLRELEVDWLWARPLP